MGQELQTTKSFQEKMFERVRDGMGDLLTDEDLKKIVEVSMNRAFFENITETDRYGSVTTKDPVFVTMTREFMEKKVKETMDAWLVEHSEEVKQMIKTQLDANISKIFVRYIDAVMYGPIEQLQNNFTQALDNLRR